MSGIKYGDIILLRCCNERGGWITAGTVEDSVWVEILDGEDGIGSTESASSSSFLPAMVQTLPLPLLSHVVRERQLAQSRVKLEDPWLL